MLTVKGGKPSPFVRKVIVALEEKGIPYDCAQVVHRMSTCDCEQHAFDFPPDVTGLCHTSRPASSQGL